MKAFKVYPFSVAAGGSQVILAEGSFVRIMAATSEVNLTIDGVGPFGPIAAGQGFRDRPFKRIVISDASGAANVGSVIVADNDFVDQTLLGTVSVIDGGKLLTLAQKTFATRLSVAGSGNYTAIQLWNPAGSGKRLVMRQFVGFNNGTNTNDMYCGLTATQLTLLSGNGKSKLSGGADSTAQVRYQNPVGVATGLAQTGVMFVKVPVSDSEPYVIKPGYGFVIQTEDVNATLKVGMTWIEELDV
ncbi:MAG: hypothetical protein V4609_13300 [Pseudomonadota bacterium]